MEIPREKGVDKAKLLKKPMELNWNFQRKRERGGGEYAGVLLEADLRRKPPLTLSELTSQCHLFCLDIPQMMKTNSPGCHLLWLAQIVISKKINN